MSESVAPLEVETKAEKKPAVQPKLAALDWVLVVVAGNTAVFLLGFSLVTDRFRAMFEDFGATVPLLTRIAARWYSPVIAGLVVAALLVAGLRVGPKRQRALLGGAAGLGVVSVAAFLYGIYWPIFAIAGQIKP